MTDWMYPDEMFDWAEAQEKIRQDNLKNEEVDAYCDLFPESYFNSVEVGLPLM